MTPDQAKQHVAAAVDAQAPRLIDISHQIHAQPELCFEEHTAHHVLCSALEDAGLEVERSAYGLDTAFVARAGHTGPHVAVICEYDALPEIGHACGHNVIAAAGLGAGLAAASLAEALGGRISVVGTPAEEGGGGKCFLLERGAFDGIDAAMMIHPANHDLTRISAITVEQFEAVYSGRSAHAAASPHKGRNALDGAVLGYMNVAALRQHIRPDERIHGVFTRGGDKPNIVPHDAAAHWYVRSPTLDSLGELRPRVLACLEAGAAAAGVTVECRQVAPVYADMLDNQVVLDLYRHNAALTGRQMAEPEAAAAVVGSTDMGNVSYAVPSIHPIIKIAPDDVAIHTPEFAHYAASESGDQAVLDGAKIMAMTTADLWLHPEAADRAGCELDSVRS
ncbi:M20 family metallopeptidase [Candidatus Poriferisocius sp.]|uniref:M20 family metallopeptidase n=1 Tax=Candidatus Poriferisocius sp. TaxID=3101276 RepID=UPI003B591423